MKVLFVCLGNICRSPAAEGVFRMMSGATVDSAGTAGWHVGKPPYGPMQAAAAQRGIALGDLRARQFGRGDFEAFDLIIAMDANNLEDIEAQRPRGNETSVRLFTDYAPDLGASEVPDPYYTRDFDGALDLIDACAKGLTEALNAQSRDKLD
ncbi:low molecular weight phosphotyrosine protein phosphatase [Cognatishimia sp. SS12]|uniref:low molecular weight protein-tyrosine-phosphatase n=1 Tax=Cognatishimia sp. SS12 TaxID=2979465 RepID=UPI00232AE735|nr:low molecular weight protein-tyrosine-phosphatase [Cognatishimia sp. SS12]MDC0738143.1 low molecular weight phosphotyrosine protein phosphatase [Cognatishimia sp. SS12]